MMKVGDTISLEDALQRWGKAAVPMVNPALPESRPLPDNWYVIYATPKGEKRAAAALKDAGFHTYLPTVKTDRRVSRRCRRWKRSENPMFPRYVFAGADIDVSWAKGLDGVLDYLRADEFTAALVPNSVLDQIRAAEDMQLFDSIRGQTRIFEPGEHVRVVEGVFSGFPAVVSQALLGQDAEVLLNILGHPTAVAMPVEYLARGGESSCIKARTMPKERRG